MRAAFSLLLGNALATAASAQPATAPADKPQPRFDVAVPEGFGDLVSEQRAVLDVFMGGHRVATAEALFAPGSFRLADPEALARALPGITDHAAVARALADPALDPHRQLACSAKGAGAGVAGGAPQSACATLHPDIAAIVFDEARFRIDLWVNPALQETRGAVEEDWLPAPSASLSLTNALGATVAGAAGSAARLAVMDNAIVGLGAGRLRADLGWEAGESPWASTLAAELDRRDMRYMAGAFWAPGSEVTGRRKILGLGMASQFDTRTDRAVMQGVPLIVHLDGRSRVDVLVDGRLATSGLFEAGNQALDTSLLPEGSYEVVLRITGPDGQSRQERRFFTRSSKIPPLGKSSLQAVVGMMVDEGTGHGLIGAVTRTPLAQVSLARRVSPRLAINVGAIATDTRQLLQAGGTVIRRAFQFDLGLAASPKGDLGLFAHLQSGPAGRLSYDLTAQIAHTRDGQPLLPQGEVRTVTLAQRPQFDTATSVAQISGDVAWQLGQSRLAISGSWRRAGGVSQYTVGPSLRVPVLRTERFELVAHADYALTERGREGYVGLSLRLTGGRRTLSAETGLRQTGGGQNSVAPVANLRASLSGDAPVLGQVQAGAVLSREPTGSYAAADLSGRGRIGEFSASAAQPLSGGARTQYAGTFRLGFGAGTGSNGWGIALGRADGGDAAVVARVEAPATERFDVLVNDTPRASVRGGQSAVIQLPGYRLYDVRLRAASGAGSGNGAALGFDRAAHRVSLFPGTVAAFHWRTRPQLSVFAHLAWPDGSPVARAALSAGSAIADTDGEGAFLMQLEEERVVIARQPDGRGCSFDLSRLGGDKAGFVSPGTLPCAPLSAPRLSVTTAP